MVTAEHALRMGRDQKPAESWETHNQLRDSEPGIRSPDGRVQQELPPEKRRRLRERPMKKLTRNQAKKIRALKRMKDDEIDSTDIPLTRDWSNAVVGKFYRPIKKSLTIRIDADVLAWLKAQGKGYQTRINALLREAMEGVRPRKRA